MRPARLCTRPWNRDTSGRRGCSPGTTSFDPRMTLRAVAVVASRPGGATASLAEAVLSGAAASGAATESFCLDHDASGEEIVSAVTAADLVVLATPTYRATYAGALKQFLDQVPRGGPRDAYESGLRSKPVA